MKANKLESGEGIVLSVRKAGEGGRSVRLFTRAEGLLPFFAPRAALRCGPGLLAPFAQLRYSAAGSGAAKILTQYEGRPLLDMMRLSYEDMTRWYYVVEIAETFFPEGQADGEAYALLTAGAAEGAARNPSVAPFVLAVQLLAAAGLDPAEDDPMEALRLSEEGRTLLRACRRWRWRGDFPVRITRRAFHDAARYVDDFAERAAGAPMKTRGAFLAAE